MKKIISALLCAAMALSLCGCGRDSSPLLGGVGGLPQPGYGGWSPDPQRNVENICQNICNAAQIYCAQVLSCTGVYVEDATTKYGVDIYLDRTSIQDDWVSMEYVFERDNPPALYRRHLYG